RYQNLLKKMEEMGAQKVGRHVVHTRMLSRKVLMDGYANQRMYMVRMHQSNDSVYAILGNEKSEIGLKMESSENGLDGPLDECSLLECGLEGSNILQQVEIYVSKADGKFEGMHFIFGDFAVGICTFVYRGSTPTGLVIEVQYTPCSNIVDLNQEKVLDELLQTIVMGTQTVTTAEATDAIKKPVNNLLALYAKCGLDPRIGLDIKSNSDQKYTLKHTAIQYVAAFNILRK
ncbi:hypothetical protein THRCLA_07241, partial [Thraustotheca clavata]